MKKFALVTVLMLLLSLPGTSASAAEPQKLLKEPLTFRVAFAETADTPIVIFLTEAYNKASELTNGEIVFEMFPAGQLGTIPDFIEQMRAGAPIICNAGFDNIGEFVPDLMPAAAPYVFLDIAEVFKLAKTPWMDDIKTKMNAVGLQAVGFGVGGYRHFMSTKPIKDASSIAGLKVRMGPSSLAQGYITVMGGSPITNNWVDTYSSLQQGVFDACESPLAILYTSSLHEVCHYLTLSGHFVNPLVQTTSSDAWARIPEPYQAVIQKCVEEGLYKCYEDIMSKEDPMIQTFKDAGVEVIETDKSTFASYVPALFKSLGYDPAVYQKIRDAIE